MTQDFSQLSIEDLNEIIAKAIDARQALIDAKRADLLAELEQLARLEGPSGAPTTRGPPPKITPNYKRYADGKGNFWTGKGRRPQWFREIQESGANLADYEWVGE